MKALFPPDILTAAHIQPGPPPYVLVPVMDINGNPQAAAVAEIIQQTIDYEDAGLTLVSTAADHCAIAFKYENKATVRKACKVICEAMNTLAETLGYKPLPPKAAEVWKLIK